MKIKIITACLCLFANALFAISKQKHPTDSTAIKKAISTYYQSTVAQNKLYNGIEELGYDRKIKGNPYFVSDELTKGSVYYDGTLFNDIPLQYDMLQDAVIIQYNDSPFRIRLLSEKLSYFNAHGHRFTRIVPGNPFKLQPGFYDLLFNGKRQLLAKRSASVSQTYSAGNQLTESFAKKTQYYIIKDSVSYRIQSVSSALKAIGQGGKQIKSYLKRNKLKYKDDPDSVLIKILSFQESQQN